MKRTVSLVEIINQQRSVTQEFLRTYLRAIGQTTAEKAQK